MVLIRTEIDRGVDYPPLGEVESWTAAAQPEVRERELIRFVGKIPLGDRWLGTIEVVGNDMVVRGRGLYERCVLGGTTTMEALEMERYMEMVCRDGPRPNLRRRACTRPRDELAESRMQGSSGIPIASGNPTQAIASTT